MEVTDIKIRRISNAGNLKATATITIDNAFAVHDIKVIEANGNTFIAMPSRRIGEGDQSRYVDIAHPINKETRESLQAMILEQYEQEEEPTPDL